MTYQDVATLGDITIAVVRERARKQPHPLVDKPSAAKPASIEYTDKFVVYPVGENAASKGAGA